ncbi:hypothetical protein [Azospirillum agricola]|uniref:hypothetical protein n=1 Tax=Azospirillum agricola TaxID=1720247 RepID=UPI000A0F307A|nr:hypothetical protein [Azospirillum agricola]SMH62563.1 hypothetical protein SAMN02982994_6366 [Azospirillum lipoferum]
MSVRQYTEANLLRMLRAYADAEAAGETLSAIALAARLGLADSTGPNLRRALLGRSWLEIIEPPRGSWPGRVRVTPDGQTTLKTGVVPPLAQPVPHSRAKALRALRLVADAEAAGSTINGHDLGTALGHSELHGVEIRADLIKRGWVVVVGWIGNTSILRLTALGRDALVDAPPPQQDQRHTLRQRRCLCCGEDFASEGPGNRVCRSCKDTVDYQSSQMTSHVVRLR